MSRYKLTIVLCSVGIIVVALTMILATYAFFTVDVEGESTDIDLITFNENTNVVYNDTSNVSMVNGYTGDSIIKKFSVENTSNYSIHYDIIFKNVLNNFLNPEELVFTLKSDNGAYRNVSMMPTDDDTIASYVNVEPGEKQEYVMEITFLETNTNQNDNMNRTFSSNIDVIPSKLNVGEDLYKKDTLGSVITKNVIGSESLIGTDKEKDGVYYTNSSNNGQLVYFYRGSNKLNNNVVILDKCYKILRTSEESGVKLVYSGKYENNECISDLERTKYNNSSNYNAYVGYMFGDVSSNNYNSEHNNIRYSEIKTNVDKWYLNNISLFKTYMDNDTVFCNNRKTVSINYNNVAYGKLGYAQNNTGYYSMLNRNPSYECINSNDAFTINNEIGNKSLNYSIGLLTVDELYFAGFERNKDNKDNFLYVNDTYYTMSPAYYNGSGAFVYAVDKNGKIVPSIVTDERGLRPVISLLASTKIKSGNGSLKKPYLLD